MRDGERRSTRSNKRVQVLVNCFQLKEINYKYFSTSEIPY